MKFLDMFGPNGGTGRARGNARNRRRGTNPRSFSDRNQALLATRNQNTGRRIRRAGANPRR